ncbi:SpoIIE family protein phosphatase [Terribacillus saccharophilus]|uniref:SpoIIE family protein phosphatase n=1 Tax=Terribacillus saccharophilus TaxID=361277 RepID=UPI001FEFF7EE|nr:SpoIIE family protein phosphatase [Terribacillus goriensis]MEC0302411.1 SpoIIE family protein phosphatase [Terribacillus saccharophilus]
MTDSYLHMDVSAFQEPKKGNYYCGDSYFYHESEHEFICVLADGLGSGEFAKESSQVVVDVIRDHVHSGIDELIRKSNEVLVGKRGVVLGILKVDYRTGTYSFTSIGNIGIMTITSGKRERCIPSQGFLAGYPRKYKISRGILQDDMIFVMFSDGVSDNELTQDLFKEKDVRKIRDMFALSKQKPHQDDITMIAMKFTE